MKTTEKSNVFVSIITPIYQVEEYLEKCINSLINQEYKDIEIILINDGSTDNSGNICNKYAQIDNRIKVFHIENSGAANARKVGIANAKGEYICFVDSDDYLPLDSIEKMYDYGMKYNLDIVIGGFNICYDTHTYYIPIKDEIIEKQEYIKRLILQKTNVGPCGKLYKKYLFNENCFPSIKRGEDFLMNLDVSTRIQNSIGYINTPVYNYYQRNNSIIHVFKTNLNYEKNFNLLFYKTLIENNLYNSFYREFLSLSINQLYCIYIDGNIINHHDEWIQFIIGKAQNINLNLKEKIIIIATKHLVLQKIIFKFHQLYKYIQKRIHIQT